MTSPPSLPSRSMSLVWSSFFGSALGRRALFLCAPLFCLWGLSASLTSSWASSALVASIYSLTIFLGVAVFMAINGVTGARWWHPIRETFVSLADVFLVPLCVTFLVIALGFSSLYPWSHPEHALHPLIAAKSSWLSTPFFFLRAIAVGAVWFFIYRALRRRVLHVSSLGVYKLMSISALFLILFALSFMVAYVDWVMSLSPEWFSTMFGVYGFAGAFQSGIAVVSIATLFREPTTPSAQQIAIRHDLGKLLFAISVFWAYIWFSQFMLIWYSNISEETFYFEQQLAQHWSFFFYANLVLNFVLPFALLMSEHAKKNRKILMIVSFIVLIGHWVDTFLLIGTPSQTSVFSIFPSILSSVIVFVIFFFFNKFQFSSPSSSSPTTPLPPSPSPAFESAPAP
jgi:MFS family permease